MIYPITLRPPYPTPDFYEQKPTFGQLNFRWRNQRQNRKNARRAHAAGYKKAFKH